MVDNKIFEVIQRNTKKYKEIQRNTKKYKDIKRYKTLARDSLREILKQMRNKKASKEILQHELDFKSRPDIIRTFELALPYYMLRRSYIYN